MMYVVVLKSGYTMKTKSLMKNHVHSYNYLSTLDNNLLRTKSEYSETESEC